MKSSISENSSMTLEKPSQLDKIPADFWLTLRTNRRLQNQAPRIQPVSRNHNLPLSFNQERLWFLEQLQPDTSVHNLLHCLHLKGVLDVAALEQSLIEIAYRHEILRTTLSIVDEQPVQIISPKIELKLSVVDLRELPPEQRQTEAQKLALEDAERPFDLAKAPLWRFQLLRLSEDEHILSRTIHHIIFDGWSHSVFLRELGIIYKAFCNGQPSPLPELPIQYADYAQTQRQWLQGEVFSSQLDYWKQQLSGNISPLELPIDYPRPAVPSYRGAYQPLELSENLTAALKKLSYQQGVSLFVTLLTAFKTLLYLYTEQEDMLVCSPVVGRHRTETKGLMGYFNNIVVMRTDLSKKPSFRELLRRVSRVSAETFAHQDIPLQNVAELPNLVRTPLTRAMFILQNIPNQSLELDGLTVSSLYIDREIANFDLSLSLQEKEGKITGGMQYKIDLFKATSITQMLEHFQTLLENLVAHPEQSISDLPLFTQIKNCQPLNTTAASASFLPEQQKIFLAPRDELEHQLTAIWEKVLGVTSIGVRDNFFELGGHSLLAVRLFADIQKIFNKDIPLATLVQAPTIEQLATLLRQERWIPPSSSLVMLKSGGTKPPLFLVAPGASTALQYIPLVRCLSSDQPVYGLQAQGLEANQLLHETIEDVASHYIQEIQAMGFDEPYMLGGRCGLGTVVAFEMAHQLQAQGKQVALLAMLDPTYQAFKNAFEEPEPDQKTLLYYISRLIRHWHHGKLLRVLRQRTRHVLQQSLHKSEMPEEIAEIADAPHGRRLQAVLKKQLMAINYYKPPVYSGQIQVFLSEQRVHVWRKVYFHKLATQGDKRFISPGNHSTMLTEPHVQTLAKQLQSCIDNVQENGDLF